jgi:hypothetical protein
MDSERESTVVLVRAWRDGAGVRARLLRARPDGGRTDEVVVDSIERMLDLIARWVAGDAAGDADATRTRRHGDDDGDAGASTAPHK